MDSTNWFWYKCFDFVIEELICVEGSEQGISNQ